MIVHLKNAVCHRAMSALTAIVVGTATSAHGASSFGSNNNGVTLGEISTNVAGSLAGVASGFEAFLYVLGLIFLVLCVLAAWKWKKSDGREGSMALVVTYLVLSAVSFAAPTVVSSTMKTLFGSTTATTLQAPTATGAPATVPSLGP